MSIWDDHPELVDRLRELARDGISYEIIAKKLGHGLTKNAVLSKGHRLGLEKPRPVVTAHREKPGIGWKRARDEYVARSRANSRAQAKIETGPGYPSQGVKIASEEELEGLGLLAELAKVTDDVPPDRRRGVADLDDRQCRWPIGDPKSPDFHFCDLTQVIGMPYCVFHVKRAYQQPEIKRRPIVRIVAPSPQIKVKA